jgi:hypothetical protein
MMSREFTIEAPKTYATAENVRKAVAKTGDEGLRHTILQDAAGRFFPVFFPTELEMTTTGIHFRWNVIR